MPPGLISFALPLSMRVCGRNHCPTQHEIMVLGVVVSHSAGMLSMESSPYQVSPRLPLLSTLFLGVQSCDIRKIRNFFILLIPLSSSAGSIPSPSPATSRLPHTGITIEQRTSTTLSPLKFCAGSLEILHLLVASSS